LFFCYVLKFNFQLENLKGFDNICSLVSINNKLKNLDAAARE